MANPYHDGSGKFCSKGEMSAAIDKAARAGDFELYSSLREDYEKATVAEAEERVKAFYENEPFVEVAANGIQEWKNSDGELHRLDGPAIVYPGGTKEWFKNGERHRDGGPAIETIDGAQEWFKNGKLHREDGPAIDHADGREEWFKNGQRHREDGPAIVFPGGKNQWFRNGQWQGTGDTAPNN